MSTVTVWEEPAATVYGHGSFRLPQLARSSETAMLLVADARSPVTVALGWYDSASAGRVPRLLRRQCVGGGGGVHHDRVGAGDVLKRGPGRATGGGTWSKSPSFSS